MRVVIADDSAITRDRLSKILAKLGHTVIAEYEDGRSVAAACAEYRPDLVVLDISMPYVNGHEVAQEIARARTASHIVIMTVMEPALVDKLLGDVNASIIRKPFDEILVARQLAAIVGRPT
jgi:DNA-binding NarL/FixJ family response regulator